MLASAGKKQEADTAFVRLSRSLKSWKPNLAALLSIDTIWRSVTRALPRQLVAAYHHAGADRLFDWALQHYIAPG